MKNKQVEVYRNLNNGRLSIRDAKTKLVLAHADVVTLTEVTFHVSEAGRQRVLRDKRKNVHAVVRGTLFDFLSADPYKGRVDLFEDKCWGGAPILSIDNPSLVAVSEMMRQLGDMPIVKYNPYRTGAFTRNDGSGDIPIHKARAVRIGINGIHANAGTVKPVRYYV